MQEVILIEKHKTNKEITLLVYKERAKKNFYSNPNTNVLTDNIELSGKLLNIF